MMMHFAFAHILLRVEILLEYLLGFSGPCIYSSTMQQQNVLLHYTLCYLQEAMLGGYSALDPSFSYVDKNALKRPCWLI
jgi:hypothetical protein